MNTHRYPRLSDLVRAGIPISGGDDGPTDTIVRCADMPAVGTYQTVDELAIARAETLDAIDDILETAAEAEDGMTDEDRAEHDALVERSDALEEAIATATTTADDDNRRRNQEVRRSRALPSFNVNLHSRGASADRSLDELLYATPTEVEAGEFSRSTGVFVPNAHGAVNSVDPIVMRGGDLDGRVAPRLAAFTPEHRDQIVRFQHLVNNAILAGLWMAKGEVSMADAFEIGRATSLGDELDHIMRAMDVDTAGEGAEWVPTGIGAELHAKVRAAGRVAPLFMRFDLPTNPWKLPVEGADATAYRVAEPTSDSASKVSASTPGTAAATFDAEILGGRVLTSRSLDADSAIAILPFLRGKLVQAFVDGEEKAILDGGHRRVPPGLRRGRLHHRCPHRLGRPPQEGARPDVGRRIERRRLGRAAPFRPGRDGQVGPVAFLDRLHRGAARLLRPPR